MKSMTGFGKAECSNDKRKVIVEIKTLNSKQADLIVKIPNVYKEKELEVRNELANSLLRGKIELYVSIEENIGEEMAQFNETIINQYYRQLAKISEKNGISLPPDILNSIIRLPDVLKTDRQEPDEKEWTALLNCIRKGLEQVNEFRQQEGKALADDIQARIKSIETSIVEVEKFEIQRIEAIKTRLRQNLVEYVGENTIDQNRFEQELIYYLEKIDINEEKVRLRNHCSYFMATMQEDGSIGKKLGFIAQEIGREINTIGSKANHADMQQVVIQMKDELEKVKEQISNIL
ncbi:MAG: YicC family protein [Bacteroidales bacterium]|jgi:uncharacterized protein (TIGR00255 family)|nr:YicC family protein [Bacteroidales bacterium]